MKKHFIHYWFGIFFLLGVVMTTFFFNSNTILFVSVGSIFSLIIYMFDFSFSSQLIRGMHNLKEGKIFTIVSKLKNESTDIKNIEVGGYDIFVINIQYTDAFFNNRNDRYYFLKLKKGKYELEIDSSYFKKDNKL